MENGSIPSRLFVLWTCRTFNERVALNVSSSELPGASAEPNLSHTDVSDRVLCRHFEVLLPPCVVSLPPNTRSWTFQKQLAAGEVSADTLSLWCTLTRRQTESSWQRSSVSDTQTAAVCVCVCVWTIFGCSLCLCVRQVLVCVHVCELKCLYLVCVCVQLSWSSQVGVSWRHCQPGLIFSFPIRGSIPVTQLTPRVALPCHFATRIKAKTSWK